MEKKKFKVVTKEIWEQEYLIEASSKEEAIELVANGNEQEVTPMEYHSTLDKDQWTIEEIDV